MVILAGDYGDSGPVGTGDFNGRRRRFWIYRNYGEFLLATTAILDLWGPWRLVGDYGEFGLLGTIMPHFRGRLR